MTGIALLFLFTAAAQLMPGPQLVPASTITAAASSTLEAAASAAGETNARFTLVGHVNDVTVNSAQPVEVHAGSIAGGWLRPRVAVPVHLQFGDKSMQVTVWYAVTVLKDGAVYAGNYPRGTARDLLSTTTGTVDLARTQGRPAPAPEAGRLRLRHAVASGMQMLADDFEPMPAVLQQQTVRIDSVAGVVRISTTGRALVDGAIGQVISVLPQDAVQPVHARIASSQVVTVEN